jgi:hypothetical protein
VPPAPPGWNKTISDLDAEIRRGERSSAGSPEVDWARNYERSLIPPGVRFPRKGDLYEAAHDIAVHYLTAWAAPYTGGGEGLLKAGDQVLVDVEPFFSQPIGVYAKPVDYVAIEARMVPGEVRRAAKYSGYYLFLKTVELASSFRLIREGPPATCPE